MARHSTYTVSISAEFAEQYPDWTPVADLPVRWFRVEINDDDDTAEVWLNNSEKRPTD